MATYQQGDDHDRITHVDMLNLLRQYIREGFAQQREALTQQREAFNTRFDALDDKVDTQVGAVDAKVEQHIADHTAQANKNRTGRRWLIGIAIGVGITVSGLVGQYLPAIVRALQSGP